MNKSIFAATLAAAIGISPLIAHAATTDKTRHPKTHTSKSSTMSPGTTTGMSKGAATGGNGADSMGSGPSSGGETK